MDSPSQTLFSSIYQSIKKECIIKAKIIPGDRVIFHLMKLYKLIFPFSQKDEAGTKKYVEFIISMVSKFLISNHISMGTIEIQMYFIDHHVSRESVLENRLQVIKMTTDNFLQHILQKRIAKSKEDCDQLYHYISCYIILFSGGGDPTDVEVLKETTVALKSILSTKEMIRFASKANSVKEVQLGDVCRIVTGIRIFNKDIAKKTDSENELFSFLQTALRKCNQFLECKMREMEERSQRMTRICLLQDESVNSDRNIDEIKAIKTYIILLQQTLYYFRILSLECHNLNEEFQACCIVLEQRLTRVRKTVKSRTAIPVVEIYPQFKDISLSWDKVQELSSVLNYISEMVYDICEIFERISEPEFENRLPQLGHDISNVASKDNVFNGNQGCELIRPETTDEFYNIDVEYNGYCIVTFVEDEGIVTPGIKEYGLIKYKNKQYCFSTTANAHKFCSSPEKYMNKIRSLALIWPETIYLLNLEKDLVIIDTTEECEKKQAFTSTCDVEVQTETHPVTSFKDYNYTSSVWQLQQKIIHLAELKKYRTHSVQTIESYFRKNTYTQT